MKCAKENMYTTYYSIFEGSERVQNGGTKCCKQFIRDGLKGNIMLTPGIMMKTMMIYE